MLDSLKTSLLVLVGLVLGCLLAIPLAWFGTRTGADSLLQGVRNTLSVVENRQQAMADQALRLQPMIAQFGSVPDADVFKDIEDRRSELAGASNLPDKLEGVQKLEEALLRGEQVALKAGRKLPSLGAWEPYQEDGRIWERQKRMLVREQRDLKDSVDELDAMVVRWPLSLLLAHKSVTGLLGGLLGDAWSNTGFLTRLSLDWLGYSLRRMAALVGQQAPPEAPQWGGKQALVLVDDAYITPLAPMIFLADAPLPEDDYNELQYTQASPENYADVELGEDKAVLENRNPPAGFAAPVPQAQKTVVYSGTN
jgi:hypothetical protein